MVLSRLRLTPSRLAVLLAFAVCSCFFSALSGEPAVSAPAPIEKTPVAPAPATPSSASVSASHVEALPPYEFPCKNGFYSTIVGTVTTKELRVCNSCETRMCVPGFREGMPIVSVMQPGEAPLVALLLGAEGKANGPLARLWINWLYEAGYHVLSFNSTLDTDFVTACGRGVSGNILSEAECSRDIIGAFLRLPNVQPKVKGVAVVGMSYGGIQALMIGKMAAEKKVDFTIDEIKAFSPPIDMMRSAELIDRWWRDDRYNYTLQQIYLAVAKHKPVTDGSCVPLPDNMMRAGVSASFRVPFVDIVEANDDVYRLGIHRALRSEEPVLNRRDYAATYGFTRFMYECTYPYWKEKMGWSHFGELNAAARLTNLLPSEPAYVETIIANDDPLNRPEDFDALKKVVGNARLTILDGGGHLGYVNHAWTKAKLQSLFKK